jgi:hypothetical protein
LLGDLLEEVLFDGRCALGEQFVQGRGEGAGGRGLALGCFFGQGIDELVFGDSFMAWGPYDVEGQRFRAAAAFGVFPFL